MNNKLQWAELYQKIWFDFEKSVKTDTFEAVDHCRSLLRQIEFGSAVDGISPECERKMKEKLLGQYAELIDSQEGVNNYAESILALAAHCKNESSQWNSRLSVSTDEELLELIPNYQKLMVENLDEKNFLATFHRESEHLKEKCIETLDVLADPPIYCTPRQAQNPNLSQNDSSYCYPVNNTSLKGLENETLCSDIGSISFAQDSSLVPVGSPNELNSVFRSGHEAESNRKFPSGIISDHSQQNFSSAQNQNLQEKNHQKKPLKVQNNIVTYKDNCNELGIFPNQNKRKKPFSEDVQMKSNLELLPFKTAREQLIIEQAKKFGRNSMQHTSNIIYGNSRKCLGTRRGPNSKFIPPVLNKGLCEEDRQVTCGENDGLFMDENISQNEKLANIDPKMVKIMLSEIMDHGPPVSWNDIAGLEFAKTTIKEIVVWPILRPDIFTGLRGPPKGLLLFGPPGTGKTLIGSQLLSFVGEGEKLVRALFAVARCHQPAVIFIDEIDSLLTQRSDTEHESSRRIKTEFLVQLDGATTSNDERLLIVGATNRPQELDEAARRRLVKRLYIPLPESHARKQIVMSLLARHSHCLSDKDLTEISERTTGYSGADMANLCKEASLGPIRSINFESIECITSDQVRPIVLKDFIDALKQVRASVSDKDLELYAEWNSKYGSSCSL